MDTPDDVPTTDRGVSTRRGVLGLAGLVGGGALLQPVAGSILSDSPRDGRAAGEDASTAGVVADATPPVGGDWPQHSADAGNTAHLPDGVAPIGDVSEAWRYNNDRFHEGLAVVDERVYVGGKSLAAVDASTGAERWSYRPEPPELAENEEGDTPEFGTPAVGDGQVYASVGFGVYDGGVPGERLVAVDAGTGEERWQYDPADSEALSVPTIYGGTDAGETVYTRDRDVVAALAPDGSVRWTQSVQYGWSVYSPLPVADGRVFVPGEDRVVALDAATGDVVWEALAGEEGEVGTGAVAAEGTLYVGAGDDSAETLVALDAATGEERWRTAGTSGVAGLSIRAASADAVYVQTDDADAISFDAADASERWRTSIEQPKRSEYPTEDLALVGGYLYAGAVCLDPSDGSVVWKHAFDVSVAGWWLGAATGGTLYVLGEEVVALVGSTDGGSGGTTAEPEPTTNAEPTTTSAGTETTETETTETTATATETPVCETPTE